MAECSIDGCGSKYKAHGLCQKHYSRLRRTGTTETTKNYGTGHLQHGYISLGARKEYQHRAVVEKIIGHKLPELAEIHHIDGK